MSETLTLEKIAACLNMDIVSMHCGVLYNDPATWEFLKISKTNSIETVSAKITQQNSVKGEIRSLEERRKTAEEKNKKTRNDINRKINNAQSKINKVEKDKEKYQEEINVNDKNLKAKNVAYKKAETEKDKWKNKVANYEKELKETTKDVTEANDKYNAAKSEYDKVKNDACIVRVSVKVGETCEWRHVFGIRVTKKRCHDDYEDRDQVDQGCVRRKNDKKSIMGKKEKKKKDLESKKGSIKKELEKAKVILKTSESNLSSAQEEKQKAESKLNQSKDNLENAKKSEVKHTTEKNTEERNLKNHENNVKKQTEQFNNEEATNAQNLKKAGEELVAAEKQRDNTNSIYTDYEVQDNANKKAAEYAETTIKSDLGLSEVAGAEQSTNFENIDTYETYGY